MNAVVFDMDGLMFDTERLCLNAWDYAGEKMGFGKLGYLSLMTTGMTYEKHIQVIKREVGENFPIEEVGKHIGEYIKDYYANNHVPVKDGLYDTLETLKSHSFKLAVASSTARKDVYHHLKDAEVFEYFDSVICGDMITHSKPDPEIFLTACASLKEKPADCFALEDSKNGTIAAHSSGCKTIMVPDLWQPNEEIFSLNVHIVKNLREATAYILENKDA